MYKLPFVIAIDGPAASGKNTLSEMLAEKLNFEFLPTGNLYRALAKKILGQNSPNKPEPTLAEILIIASHLSREELWDISLNSDIIAFKASQLASIPDVRNILNELQRDFIKNASNGIVVEGRDIGTIIWPNAQVKFFIETDLETRAKRRYHALSKTNPLIKLEDIYNDLQSRDSKDTTRLVAPLKKAEDAIVINNSAGSPDETVKYMLNFISQTDKEVHKLC